jgi:hypothetical protein
MALKMWVVVFWVVTPCGPYKTTASQPKEPQPTNTDSRLYKLVTMQIHQFAD